MSQTSSLTFGSGMVTDIDKTFREPNTYLKAENFTATSTDGGTIGSLHNARGNELDTSIVFATNHEVVGYASVVDNTVYFTTDGTDSNIYYHEDNVLILKYSDSASTYKLNFNLLPEYRIVAVGRQELTVLEKVYWVDGLNEYRFIDLDKDYTGKEANIFNAIPPNDLAATMDTEVLPTAGNYTSGIVYHSYQFYNVNGASSTISPTSFGSKLSEYTELKDGGNEEGEDSNCAVQISLTGISADILSTYNRIRIYAILYTNEDIPVINIAAERSLINDSIIILDTGSSIGTLELSEYTSYNQTTYIPKAIATKQNILLIGNLKESTFSSTIIDDWDSRAYRFIGTGETFSYAEITEAATPANHLRISNTTFKVEESTVTGVNIGDDVPIDFDCANDYNNIFTKDLVDRRPGTGQRTGYYKYQSDNTTLGGEGLNVSYSFVDKGKYIETEYNTSIRTDKPVNNTEGDTYSNSAESALLDMQECQDGEVYRIGIKFYNSKGQSSFVKWVGDILWEERYDATGWGLGLTSSITGADGSPNYTGYKYSQYGKAGVDDTVITSRAKVLNVTITPPSDPEITSWQVVRAERENVDATVVGNGMLQQTLTDSTIERPSSSTYLDAYDDSKTLFKFSSPELQFNDPSTVDFTGFKVRVYNKYSNTFTDSSTITVTGKAYVAKTADLKGLSAVGSTTFTNLISIEDSKWVKPSYAQDGLNDVDVSIGTYIFRNSDKKLGDDYGAGNSSYVLNLDRAPDIIAGSDNVDNSNFYVSILKNTDSTRYGGIAYQDILNTVYIPFSNAVPITTTSQLANKGDVVSIIHYFLQALYYDSGDFTEEAFQFLSSFPVQTKVDVRRRLDRILDYYHGLDVLDTHPSPEKVMFLAETVEKGISLQGSVYDTDIGDLYRYNTVYSAEPSFEFSISKPFDFINEPHSTVKVLASEKKINGEREDQWTNFLVNNFIEVDSAHGPLNDLNTEDNSLYFWQDKAFGTLAVNDRSLITDESGAQLSLGTGAVLERYDYISNVYGNVDKYSISSTENGLFWIYSPKNLVCTFDSQIKELSTSGAIKKYLQNKKPIINPISVVDFIADEVLFKINDEVLAYDYLIGKFTSINTYIPEWFVPKFDGNFLSSDDSISFYNHNSDTVNRGNYYGVDNKSTFKHIVKDNYPQTKVFDVISWNSTSIDSNDVILYDNTFDRYRFTNDYQNTDWQDIAWKRKERSFTSIVPRDRVNATQGSNVDIYNPSNLDGTQTYKRRMRDKYMILEMEYDNSTGNKFSIPYINVNYRTSIR